MFLFRKKVSKPLVGVDISSQAIKVLELSQSNGKFRIEGYGVAALPQGAVVENDVKDVKVVGETLQKLLKKARISGDCAATAVSGSSVITKKIEMRAGLSDSELESQIQIEADRHIPYPLNEVSMDYQVIGPVEHRTDIVEVLLAASRSDIIESRVEAITLAGMTTKVVEVELYSVERAFTALNLPKAEGEHHTIAVVDIGAMLTTLSVIRDNSTIYNREQIFGGSQLTEEIQRRYGLSYAEAGLAKKQGGLPDDYIPEVLEPFKEALIQQVSRSLQFFFSSSAFTTVDHVVLAGGTSSIPGLDDMVFEKLGITASVANPFSKMSLGPNIPISAISQDAPSLMICAGLAMRSFL